SACATGDRINRGAIEERELRLREGPEFVRLGETLVEAPRPDGAGLDECGVEYLSARFIDGEAFMNQLANEPAGLRSAVHVGQFARRDLIGAVLECRGSITNGRHAEARNRRILRLEREFVRQPGREAGFEVDPF